MSKKHKNYSSEEKVSLLKKHLVNGTPVSDICEKNGLRLTVFCRRQRQFFEQGATAFKKTISNGFCGRRLFQSAGWTL